MSTSRPFAYNSGPQVPGTEKLQDITIGLTESFSATFGGLEWYNGPDEDLGYIICKTSSPRTWGGSSSTTSANTIGFWRSDTKSEASFLSMVNGLFSQSLVSGDTAKTYLNSSGYWTSWVTMGSFSIPLNTAVYYTSYFTDYMLPSSISIGNDITDFLKYDDFSATASSSPYSFGGSGATYVDGYATFSQLNGRNIAYCSGTYSRGASFASIWYGDATSDISFMHKPNESYTIYFVGKPQTITYGSYLFTTYNSFIPPEDTAYEMMRISPTWSVVLEITQDNGLFLPSTNILSLTVETSLNDSDFNSKPLRIFSVRGQHQNNTASVAAWGYVNGVLTSTASNQISTNTNPSLYNLQLLGAETSVFGVDGPYKGYFGEILIYNELHSESTHTDIVNLLKTRWGIS